MDANELAILGREMLDKNGLQDWKFGYLGSNSCFGITQFRPKKDAPPENLQYDLGIAISHTLAAVNSIELVKDVLLHEIAHARIVQEYLKRMRTRAQYEQLHCEMHSVSGHSDIWKLEYIKIGGCGMECWADWKGPRVELPPTFAESRGLVCIQFIGEAPRLTFNNGVSLLE